MSEPGIETTAAKPQEDEVGGSRLACFSGALATCSLLLASASSSLLLASASSSLRIEELLVAGILLLASASGLFLNETEAMVLVRPQFVDGPLPIPVCAVSASASPMKNGPPILRRQQSGILLVFADGSLKPFFVGRRATIGVRGGGLYRL